MCCCAKAVCPSPGRPWSVDHTGRVVVSSSGGGQWSKRRQRKRCGKIAAWGKPGELAVRIGSRLLALLWGLEERTKGTTGRTRTRQAQGYSTLFNLIQGYSMLNFSQIFKAADVGGDRRKLFLRPAKGAEREGGTQKKGKSDVETCDSSAFARLCPPFFWGGRFLGHQNGSDRRVAAKGMHPSSGGEATLYIGPKSNKFYQATHRRRLIEHRQKPVFLPANWWFDMFKKSLSPAHEASFNRILLRTVLLPLGVTVLASILLAWLVGHLLGLANWVDHTDRVIADARTCEKLTVDMETGLHGTFSHGQSHVLAALNEAEAQLDGELQLLSQQVLDNPFQAERAEAIRKTTANGWGTPMRCMASRANGARITRASRSTRRARRSWTRCGISSPVL